LEKRDLNSPAMARFSEIVRRSPNFDSTCRHEQWGVLVHHSVMPYEETIAFMCDPKSRVSYHVLIAPSGERCTLVPDEHVAWHAGVSVFQGRQHCNNFLLGLSFAGDTYRTPLTREQIESCLDWLEVRWDKLGWNVDRVTDHRQVSPGRKNDLNPAEWARFQEELSSWAQKRRPRAGCGRLA
jgi:N-acetyl-anhydromuramoyl-L-alanine amidase